MSFKNGPLLASRHIPKSNGPIGASRRQRLAVRRKDCREHFISMPNQLAEFLAGGHIPHLNLTGGLSGITLGLEFAAPGGD
jgi:hypothetical protein